MHNTILSRPNGLLIDLSVMKSHLRIEHDHEDKYLEFLVTSATEVVENYTGKSILKKRYRLIASPDEFFESQEIEIPIAPVFSVTDVSAISSQSEPRKLQHLTKNLYGRTVVRISPCRYPVSIEYVAGMAKHPEKIPMDIRYSVLQIAKNMYESTGKQATGSPYIPNILQKYKDFR